MARSDSPRSPIRASRAGSDQLDYWTLSEFRYRLRCFLEFSQSAARTVGLTSRQHQALLAIKGFAGRKSVTVGDLAERLRVRHHSAVELADRLSQAGLVARLHDAEDRRRVLLALTPAAEERLAALSAAHLEELHRLRPALLQILDRRSEASIGEASGTGNGRCRPPGSA